MTIYALFFCLWIAGNPEPVSCNLMRSPFESLAECNDYKSRLTAVRQNATMKLVCMKKDISVWQPAQ
jgi:hypothetical protein